MTLPTKPIVRPVTTSVIRKSGSPGHAVSLALSSVPRRNRGGINDIGGWLRTLGLERYEAAFRDIITFNRELSV